MKKYIKDFIVLNNSRLDERHILLKLTPEDGLMPEIVPGQFVQVKSNASEQTFLRLPISVNFVDYSANELWLMVQMIGEGTKALGNLTNGDLLNLVLPLGNGFGLDDCTGNILLVGGGVGVAPMLYTSKVLHDKGITPVILLGARTAAAVLEKDLFEQYGRVLVTTEDGSMGEKGFVTQHSALAQEKFDKILVCGPKPMMVAVARYAKQNNINCEVSLENMMACGLGACLCCVEKTVKGNVCVCKEGPVFNIYELTWQL